MERLRHGERGEVADGLVRAIGLLQAAVVEEHAHRLDRVERDPLGALHDRPGRALRQARDQAAEQLEHLGIGQRLEAERREAALAGSPGRAALEKLGPGEGDDVDRLAAGPGQEILDEVEEPLIGPLEVLEDEHHGRLLGDALEVGPPRREQLAALRLRAALEAQELEEGASRARRSSSSGTNSSRLPVRASRVASSSAPSPMPRRMRTISPSAQNVIPSP